MAVQTTFNIEQSGPYAGMKAGVGPDTIGSYRNGEAAAVPFGVLVQQGTDDGEFDLYDTTGGLKLLGVLCHTHALSNRDLSNDDGIAVDAMGNVMERGRVFVEVEDAVAAGEPAFARFVAGAGGTQLGAFRSDADTASADAIPGLMYKTSASAGGIAELSVNLPQ